ncbi:MAG: cytochrome b/b6 domain-containing protein [Nitrospinae bacterium]|nr:cytochrome b/b6 domain-containing protein [Nitrospinota bacterium]
MKIKVWDLPTRIFHWLLVLAYVGAYFTSESEWLLEYHAAAGYIALGLIVFRILWGFTGNRYARFSDFIKGWGDVKSYLLKIIRFSIPRYIGHNPAVGLIVLFMLLITAAISLTGIVVYGGEEGRGIAAGFFTFKTAIIVRAIHLFLAYLAVVMIVTHISAALIHHFILKENIIYSMFTGYKEDMESWSERVSHMKEEGLSVARLIVWIFVVILGGLGLVYLPPKGKTDFSRVKMQVVDDKGFVVELKHNKKWAEECAKSCHIGFHPNLLPASSWEKLMSGLSNHFGEDAAVDDITQKEILGYLVSSSAEHSVSEASKKLLYSIKKGDTPIKITDIPYWMKKHSEISDEVYKRKSIVSKSNCIACHPGSDIGSFEDRDIYIPEK